MSATEANVTNDVENTQTESEAQVAKTKKKSTTSFKQLVLLVLVANVILLPAMWYREKNKPQVLGASEQVQTDGAVPQAQNGDSSNGVWSIFGADNSTTAQQSTPEPVRKAPGNNSVGSVPQKSNPTPEPPRKTDLLLNADSSSTTTVLKENVMNGKIVWRDGFKARLAARNIPLSAAVVVTGPNTQPKVFEVDGVAIMDDSTVAICDRETFIVLGGDPTIQKEIQGQVIVKK
ncbi:MAG: hypothetical protein OHK0017_06760 [Patescibacteria group bacterium]